MSPTHHETKVMAMMDGALKIDPVDMLDIFTDTLRLIGERHNSVIIKRSGSNSRYRSLIPVTKDRQRYLGWDSSFILIIDKRSDCFINLRFL